jgi:hypothetical protein
MTIIQYMTPWAILKPLNGCSMEKDKQVCRRSLI